MDSRKSAQGGRPSKHQTIVMSCRSMHILPRLRLRKRRFLQRQQSTLGIHSTRLVRVSARQASAGRVFDLGKALTWTDPVVPMCTVPGKETLPASDPGCTADPANPTTLNFELPGVASGTGTIGFVLSGACTSAVSNQAVAATPSAIADKSVLARCEIQRCL